MKLLLNAESLVPPLTGIGLYTRHLLDEYLSALAPEDVQCFSGGRLVPGADCLAGLDRQRPAAAARRERRLALLHRLADHTTLPYRLYQYRNNRAFRAAVRPLPRGTVYHEPNYVLKPFSGPAVMTVHDLSVFHYPQFHPASRVRHLERNLPRSLERAAHVITDSEVVRRELMDRFGLDGEAVSAIHLGVSGAFAPVRREARDSVLAGHGLENQGYVFCVSTFEPRKNLTGLLDAFLALPEPLRRRFPLVLAGSRGWLSQDMESRLRKLDDRGQVRRLGYVPREHLPALYSGARLFVFPSVYEGFGLPVLEAMACGTPVVTSRDTSMAEITGEDAVLVTRGDSEALTEAMAALIEDDEGRRRLARGGLERAAGFTWSRCAERHLAIFRALAPSG